MLFELIVTPNRLRMNVLSEERFPNSSQSMIKTMLHCDTVQLVNFNRPEKINIGYQFFFCMRILLKCRL